MRRVSAVLLVLLAGCTNTERYRAFDACEKAGGFHVRVERAGRWPSPRLMCAKLDLIRLPVEEQADDTP